MINKQEEQNNAAENLNKNKEKNDTHQPSDKKKKETVNNLIHYNAYMRFLFKNR